MMLPNPKVLVPSSLVFAELVSLRLYLCVSLNCSTLAERTIVAQKVHKRMDKRLAAGKMQVKHKRNNPPSASRIYHPGDEILA